MILDPWSFLDRQGLSVNLFCRVRPRGSCESSGWTGLRTLLHIRLLVLVPGLVLMPLFAAQAQTAGEDDEDEVEIVYTLRASTEGALETDNLDAQKLETELLPGIEIAFDEGIRFTAKGRFRYDAFDELEPGSPSQDTTSPESRRLRFNSNSEAELREFFFEVPTDFAYFVVGKQQTVWGQSDGLKVLDVVNPQDFREFILDDFEDSRIPLWTVKAEIPLGDVLAELVWIPDTTYNDIPEPDAAYAFTSPSFVPVPVPGTSFVLDDPDRPDNPISDSDIGFRLSAFVDGWDLSFNYLYAYDDTEIPFQNRDSFPTVVIEPEFRRTHLIGGTFSNAFGDFVVRGEAALSTNRYFITDNPNDDDGIEESPNFNYVLGLDWYGMRDTLISGQLFQDIIVDNTEGVTRDRTETTITLLARRSFLNDRLALELQWLQGLNIGDGLVRPKVQYDFTDSVTVWGGADVFYGGSRGLFGQFDGESRLVLGVALTL